MRIDNLINIIEAWAPLSLQEPWDNTGFQIKISDKDVSKVLVAMEITDSVADEAVALGADVVVTHHPMIFSPINKIDYNDITGNYIIKLIQNEISVYSTHTSFDKCQGGNNDFLAKLLHLDNIGIMKGDESGFCRSGLIDVDCTIGEYIEQISEWLKIDKTFMNFTGNINQHLKKVGLCTGSGAEFIQCAIKDDCDLFITGDLKYHSAQTAKEMGINVLDIGHYGSEKIFADNMSDYLSKNTDIEIIKSRVNINPFSLIL